MKYFGYILLFLIAIGFTLPERLVIPIKGGQSNDWNHRTFWSEPWGKSGVHKGIDIFAKRGTPLLSATDGIIVYTGHIKQGGNVILMLGAKWRLHYFAHLKKLEAHAGQFVTSGQAIGRIGNSGNARGKPAHLHYSIVTLTPYPWRWDFSTQGWKKIFYLDPSVLLLSKKH